MTGAELGKLLNISQQQISRYERGINKIPIDILFHILI
ncbi:fimbrial operon regulator, partial [Proteus mirabilis]